MQLYCKQQAIFKESVGEEREECLGVRKCEGEVQVQSLRVEQPLLKQILRQKA